MGQADTRVLGEVSGYVREVPSRARRRGGGLGTRTARLSRSVGGHMRGADHAWLPDGVFRPIGTRRTLIRGSGPLVDTVHGEVARACERFGGSVSRDPGPCDLVLELNG